MDVCPLLCFGGVTLFPSDSLRCFSSREQEAKAGEVLTRQHTVFLKKRSDVLIIQF